MVFYVGIVRVVYLKDEVRQSRQNGENWPVFECSQTKHRHWALPRDWINSQVRDLWFLLYQQEPPDILNDLTKSQRIQIQKSTPLRFHLGSQTNLHHCLRLLLRRWPHPGSLLRFYSTNRRIQTSIRRGVQICPWRLLVQLQNWGDLSGSWRSWVWSQKREKN